MSSGQGSVELPDLGRRRCGLELLSVHSLGSALRRSGDVPLRSIAPGLLLLCEAADTNAPLAVALITAQSTRPAASAASGIAPAGCVGAGGHSSGTSDDACWLTRPLPASSPLVNWETLGFGLHPTAAMYVATCERGKEVRALS